MDDKNTKIVLKTGRPKGRKDSYKRPSRRDLSTYGTQSNELTSRYIKHARNHANLPPIDISDIEQVENRINYYLDSCEKDGIKPTVSGLCNCLGIERTTLYKWYKGMFRKGTHQEIILRFYKMLEEFWEIQMNEGKINPVTGIFLGKNNFGYADKQEVVVTPNNPLDDPEALSREEIERKYLEDVVFDINDV